MSIKQHMSPKFMILNMDAGEPVLWGVFRFEDRVLSGSSPSANLVG